MKFKPQISRRNSKGPESAAHTHTHVSPNYIGFVPDLKRPPALLTRSSPPVLHIKPVGRIVHVIAFDA